MSYVPVLRQMADGKTRAAGRFDESRAQSWAAKDGSELVRTAMGRWALRGATDAEYFLVREENARQWLIANGHLAAVRTIIDHDLREDELPSIGRPPIGKPINLRLPDSLREQIDALARTNGLDRSQMIRRLLEAGIHAWRIDA